MSGSDGSGEREALVSPAATTPARPGRPVTQTNAGSDPTFRYHGTVGGYTNHRCRCDRCREAMRVDKRRYLDENPDAREAHRLRLLARRGRPPAPRVIPFAPRVTRA